MTTPITWNATDIAAGVRDIRGKWVNSPYYRSGSIEWNPLTPTFLNDGNKWQTSECPVIVSAPRLATQPIRFVNGVAWDAEVESECNDALAAFTCDTGVTLAKAGEMLAALAGGKVSASSSLGVTTLNYRKRDGTTTSFTAVVTESDKTRATTGALS